jgi:filamentous hemagglutinin family protein
LNGQTWQELFGVARFSGASLALAVAGALTNFLPRVATAQHITVDGRLSPAQTLVGPNYSIGANLGKQVGSNLFHSFGQFGLATGENAAFSGPATITNVIGRVTGGNQSSIDGKIQSNIAGANLYLINPSGVVFGPNATVNVSGSFHASTADYLKMSDGARFQATNPDGSTLSAAPPVAFGFMIPKPAAITVNGSTLGPVPGTLGLVGGPVSIKGGTLSAPAGTIHVASIAGTGEMPVDPRNTPALTVTSFGPVGISGGSTLNVSDPRSVGGGGSVFIRSGALTIDASEINADNYGSGSGGQLVLRGDSQVALSNGAYAHAVALGSGSGAGVIISTAPSGVISADAATVLSGSVGPGSGGPLSLATSQLTLTNGAAMTSSARGSGNGGPITITANSVLLDGGAALDQSTGIFSDTSGVGSGGSIAIVASELRLHNGADVLAQSSGAGAGGRVTASVGGSLTVDGPVTVDMTVGAVTSTLAGSGSVIQGAGNTGDVGVPGGALVEGALSIASNGQIASATAASGNGGSVSIMVDGQLTIDGARGDPNFLTGIASSSKAGSTGNAGSVAVEAGALSIVNRGSISSSALQSSGNLPASTGSAGGVTVDVAGLLSMAGLGSRIATSVNLGTVGNAGSVAVTAPQIMIASGAEIVSTTAGTGAGGSVSVTTPGALLLDGAEVANTQIAASATGPQSGSGGSVTVGASALTIDGGAQIASSTAGPGKGGDVAVTVAKGVILSGAGSRGPSGITTSAQPGSSGRAGKVVLMAGGAIALSGGAAVASTTAGAGNGGTVQVTAQGPLTLANLGTRIITSTEPGSSGNAGAVVAAAPQITIGSGAEIASTTAGTGTGGSVNITTGALVLDGIANTTIAASALGVQSGLGGSAMVKTSVLTIGSAAQVTTATSSAGNDIASAVANGATVSSAGPSDASGMTASAGSGSQAGEIALKAGGAAKAASSASGAGNGARAEALRVACAARAGQPISGLIQAGRGGLSQDPEATLPALYIAGRDLNPNPQPGPDTVESSGTAIHATARLTMRCG